MKPPNPDTRIRVSHIRLLTCRLEGALAVQSGPELLRTLVREDRGAPDLSSASAAELGLSLAQVAIGTQRGRVELTAEVVHTELAYRPEGQLLYEAFLSAVANPSKLLGSGRRKATPAEIEALTNFRYNLGTHLRRLGGAENLSAAERLLNDTLPMLPFIKATDDRQRLESKLLYDLGYIDYLRGNAPAAEEKFWASARAAEGAGNQIGAFMSGSLAHLTALHSGRESVDVTREFFEQALQVFSADPSPDAQRWVVNARSHLLDIGILTGDSKLVDAQIAALESSSWFAHYGQESLQHLQRARVALSRGEYSDAARKYGARLDEVIRSDPAATEQLARDVLDYGRALAGLGDIAAAQKVWGFGLRLPAEAGNWIWTPQIARSLAQIRPTPDGPVLTP